MPSRIWLGAVLLAGILALTASAEAGLPIDIDSIPGSKYAQVQGWRIHYYDWGPSDASIVLVCVHGWAGNGLDFYALGQAFAARSANSRIIALDLPGAGFSQRPASSIGMEGHIDFLAHWFNFVRRELIAEPAARLIPVAHSMGGHILLRSFWKYRFGLPAADQTPEMRSMFAGFDRLVLFAPDGLRGEEGAIMGLRNRAIIRKFGPRLSPSLMRNNLAPAYFKFSQVPPLVAEATIQSFYYDNGFHSLADITVDTLGAQPLDGQLGDFDIPILLLWGRQDKVLKFRYSRVFAAELPRVQFCALDQCGHVLQTDLPQTTAELVQAFLNNP